MLTAIIPREGNYSFKILYLSPLSIKHYLNLKRTPQISNHCVVPAYHGFVIILVTGGTVMNKKSRISFTAKKRETINIGKAHDEAETGNRDDIVNRNIPLS